MPRRYIDYPDAFAAGMMVASIGSYISGLGAIIFLIIIEAFVARRRAAINPWGEGATTLEWTVASPPPYHTFEELPKVKSRSAERFSMAQMLATTTPQLSEPWDFSH